ncbi:MAG: hypothetical protein FWJ83_07880 [Limnochordales bacterium]|nr:MAG: hypothetical protein DIU83_08850 [Bacillota bacterium]
MFVANERTRVIHDTESQTDHCGLYSEASEDQVTVPDIETVKLMIELEHFRACPECMRDLSWDRDAGP